MFEEEIVRNSSDAYSDVWREILGTKNYKRHKLDLIELKCLQSMDRVTKMGTVRNKEVKRRFDVREKCE